MNFSELVDAIGRDDTKKINALIHDLMPRLISFLQIHMGAERQDAEDCAQETVIIALEAIRADEVRDNNQLFSFMLTTCRNTYLNLIKKRKDNYFNDDLPTFGHQPQQLFRLIDEERKKVLQWCLKQLSKSYRNFISFWFKYPDADTDSVAEHFGISLSNAWTRKHRILKKLSECCRKKSSD